MDFDVGYGPAALAGLLSFLSPCVLPMVPFYLCYIAGVSFETLTARGAAGPRVVLSAIFFAAGIITIFVGLGATATVFGQQLREWFDVLRWIAAAVIGVLGLHFLGVFRIALLNRQARLDVGDRRMGLAGAFLVGMSFAFAWTPCVGPVLAAILFTAGAAETADKGALLLLAYAAGMTLPFILAAVFVTPFLTLARRMRPHLGKIEKAMGAALVLFAVLIASNWVNRISEWMLEIAPDIGTLQ